MIEKNWQKSTFVVWVLKYKVTAFEDCDIPPNKYDVINYVNHTFILTKYYGKMYLSVNFTINNQTPPVTYNLRGYGTNKEERKKDFDINNLSCRHPVTAAILKKIKIIYNPVDCTGQPGKYSIPRINMDEFSRYYQYTVRNYNSYTIEIELSSNKGVMICLAISMNVSLK